MVNFRLIKLVESRIHREVYVRFGGEYPKIRHRNMKMDVGCLAYIMSTVGNDELESYLYKGLMAGLGDPYSTYYTAEEYKELTEDTEGVYRGIAFAFS